ncbi:MULTISPECIES: hypothetical protein [unclassified Bradyrhizobium]|uniref:hypothetical protein n=1 Tax=unclassified Bradyrhizobium TaxID=2631580 RepID=UPI002306A203|nr:MULTISPECIES: hypothetical protein [unclassified Bradyrhizobium]
MTTLLGTESMRCLRWPSRLALGETGQERYVCPTAMTIRCGIAGPAATACEVDTKGHRIHGTWVM